MLVSSLWLGRGRSGTPIGDKLKKTFQAVDNCLFALFFYPWLSTSMEAQNLRCRCPRHTLFCGTSTAVKGDVTELRGNEMSPNHVTQLLLCSKLLFLNRLEINDPTSLPRTGNAGEIGHRRRWCGPVKTWHGCAVACSREKSGVHRSGGKNFSDAGALAPGSSGSRQGRAGVA